MLLETLLVVGGGFITYAVARPKGNGMLSETLTEAQKGAFRAALEVPGRQYADLLVAAGERYKVPPTILAAILKRESNNGLALSPPGPVGTGDGGHGRGLMQVDDRSQIQWLAAANWRDAATNINKGAEILRGKVRYFQLASAGAGDPRPLKGDALWRAAVAAYNAGEGRVLKTLKAGQNPDSVTAHGDYGSAVLAYAQQLEQKLG